MSRLLVIADDFTGALDTGVQFAKEGIKVKVFFSKPEDIPQISDNEVLVYNSESRHLEPQQAYDIVRRAAVRAKETGYTNIYKKTDSGLRGHLGAELSAAMEGFGRSSLHFFPSFPKVNRTTVNGSHFIDGVPVNASVFGRDPFNPVKSSCVARIIAEESTKQCYSHSVGETGKQDGIHIHDAVTDADFTTTAKILSTEDLSVSAGCAGFAPVLLKAIGLEGNTKKHTFHGKNLIVVSGSINPVTQKIMEYSEKSGIRRDILLGEEKACPTYFASGKGDSLVRETVKTAKEKGVSIIDVGPKEEPGHETENYMKDNGLAFEDIMSGIAKNLGGLFRKLVDSTEDAVFMCIGGDTLSSTVESLGLASITPIDELYPGVVLTEVTYNGRMLSIITKSGGFGDEDLIQKILDKIR